MQSATCAGNVFQGNYPCLSGHSSSFRNLLAHEYFGVDLEIVWNTVRDDLPMLMAAVQQIVRGIK